MNRRQFLKVVGAGAAAAVLPAPVGAAPPPVDKPNVLLLMVDDLNFWVNCIGGHTGVQTPVMDRLASQGVLFQNTFCPSPLCNPARAALMTGMRPATSGIYENNQPFRLAIPQAVTIPQHFQAHGYHAIGGGKIFHTSLPDPASWNEYFPSQRKTEPVDIKPRNQTVIERTLEYAAMDIDDGNMADGKVATWAVQALGKRYDRPFFMAAGFRKPHVPLNCPKKYFDLYPLDSIQLPKVQPDLNGIPPIGKNFAMYEPGYHVWLHHVVLQTNSWKPLVQAYLACMSFVDAQLGRVLAALEASPYAKNTVIVMCSDHGFHLGPKLHWKKQCLWEEATHVPLMIVAPGITQPGGKCIRTVSTMDLYPTLIDVCGLSPRAGLEGTSLLPLLKNPQADDPRVAVTTWQRGNHAVRSEKWRFIRYYDGTEELYDKVNDALEWTNLASDPKYADVKKDLARWLPRSSAPDAPNNGKPAE